MQLRLRAQSSFQSTKAKTSRTSSYFTDTAEKRVTNETAQSMSKRVKIDPEEENSNGAGKPSVKRCPPKHIKIEVENEKQVEIIKSELTPQKSSGKVKREIPPSNWLEVYEKIREYRRTRLAPVDTMGCERLGNILETPQNFRWQTLVALMLSSQTKDQVTAAAIGNLNSMPGGLTINAVLNCPNEKLSAYINKVGFWRRKAEYLKKTAQICKDKFGGDIPNSVQELTELPGVGPKMAYLAMQCAWHINAGIGVDIHVHRITNRLGWCNTEKGGPEATRMALETWLPSVYWTEINPLLVGFGQITCLPRGQKCNECPVKEFCPSRIKSRIQVKKEKKVNIEVSVKEEEDENGIKTAKKDENILVEKEKEEEIW